MLIFVVLLGPLSDVFYSEMGLIKYNSHQYTLSWIPPLWIFFLWALFAVNINLFSWLKKRWVLAAVLGAIGGPMSYLSVVRLGGASLLKPLPLVVMIVGGIWAILFPGLMVLNEHFKMWFKR